MEVAKGGLETVSRMGEGVGECTDFGEAFLTFVLLVQYETPRKGQTLPVSLNILARAVALCLGAWVLEPNRLGLNPVLPLASSVTLDRGFDMFIIPFSHL